MGFFSSGAKSVRKAARRQAIGFQTAQVEQRSQREQQLEEFRATEATSRGDVEASNIRAFQDLDFRRGREADIFGGVQQRLGEFDVREQERFDLGISREDERLRLFDEAQARAEGVDVAQREEFGRFGDIGREAFGQFARGSTIAGQGANIDEILQGPAFAGLRARRLRDLQGQLSSSGLRRSGTALERISDLTPELAFSIEQQLSGRQRAAAETGLGALGLARSSRFDPRFQGTTTPQAEFTGFAPSALGEFAGGEDTLVREAQGFDFADPNLISLILGEAGAESQGILASAAAKAKFRSSILKAAGGALSGGLSGFANPGQFGF